MTRQVQRQRQRDDRAPAGDTGSAADLRNDELSADVECCLAEIDEALQAGTDERAEAKLEFERISTACDWQDCEELRVWQARYAHLGLRYGISCCGVPVLLGG